MQNLPHTAALVQKIETITIRGMERGRVRSPVLMTARRTATQRKVAIGTSHHPTRTQNRVHLLVVRRSALIAAPRVLMKSPLVKP